jgi:hypothetical protein
MRLEFLLLADAVENVNGKLYIMGGGWTQFKTANFPALSRLGIAVSFIMDWEEIDKIHIAKVDISDEQKHFEMAFEARVTAGKPEGAIPGSAQRVFLTLNLNLPVPQPGKYRITASLADEQKREVEFEALHVPAS